MSLTRNPAISLVLAALAAAAGAVVFGNPRGAVVGLPILVWTIGGVLGMQRPPTVGVLVMLAVSWAVVGLVLSGDLMGAVIGLPVLLVAVLKAFGIDDPSGSIG